MDLDRDVQRVDTEDEVLTIAIARSSLPLTSNDVLKVDNDDDGKGRCIKGAFDTQAPVEYSHNRVPSILQRRTDSPALTDRPWSGSQRPYPEHSVHRGIEQ